MNDLVIQSHKGAYPVHFGPPFQGLEKGLSEGEHLIIDAKVASLYEAILEKALRSRSVLKIVATEENKSLEKIPEYILHLSEQGIRRGDVLVAVGGGIIQDIVAFIAAVLFRGLSWRFYPTTLLAQADSCIGSKSSINVGRFKNQVGTFTPPTEIHIATDVLETLEEADFRSGMGEMIKAHLIGGFEDFRKFSLHYPRLAKDKKLLLDSIRRSLEIKKILVEQDEFDQKERLILNYGHTFGHAIESATDYKIPHGIAITIGVDMANFFSKELGLIDEGIWGEVHPPLRKNYNGFQKIPIPFDRFLNAISKDKKNVKKDISLILTRGPGKVFRERQPHDERFRSRCREYFERFAND